MATNNQTGQGKFAEVPAKQKAMAAITFIVIVVVIWQIIGLFRGDSKPTTAPASGAAKKTVAMNATSTTPGAPTPSSDSKVVAPANENDLMPAGILSLHREAGLLKNQQEEQQNYLTALNQLQILKVKRDIAETNQAIAAARLATATADKSMSDLLTQPTPPQVPIDAYANKLAGPTPLGVPVAVGGGPMGSDNKNNPTATTAAPPAEGMYDVISVSMEFQKWNAVLGSQGKLYNVIIGDVLTDGSKVVAINKNGVWLEKDGKKKKISILTSI